MESCQDYSGRQDLIFVITQKKKKSGYTNLSSEQLPCEASENNNIP